MCIGDSIMYECSVSRCPVGVSDPQEMELQKAVNYLHESPCLLLSELWPSARTVPIPNLRHVSPLQVSPAFHVCIGGGALLCFLGDTRFDWGELESHCSFDFHFDEG